MSDHSDVSGVDTVEVERAWLAVYSSFLEALDFAHADDDATDTDTARRTGTGTANRLLFALMGDLADVGELCAPQFNWCPRPSNASPAAGRYGVRPASADQG